jgi:hypothetical protein
MAEVNRNENADVSMVDAADDLSNHDLLDSKDPEKIVIVGTSGFIESVLSAN